MKHSRHPFAWRADAIRAALACGVVLAAGTTSASAAKSRQGPNLDGPSVAIPIVAPSVDVSSPAMPGFSLPTVAPSMPGADSQSPQFNTTRRAHELKVAEHRRNRAMRTSHPDRIEYVDALIHLERYDEAIEELAAIEERYPGAYINAHLLGVACELSGDLKEAHRWFAAAVARDPEAQSGTGWLRVAMIEAHLALKGNPAWLDTHSVLDGVANRSEQELQRAVEVQVLERREFFAEKDPVLADLFFQVGARMEAPENRARYFTLSLETGSLRHQDIDGQLVIRAKGPTDGSAH